MTAREAWAAWQHATDPTERENARQAFEAACERAR